MRPDAGTILTNSLFTTLRITPTLINEFDRDESGWIHRSGTNGDPFACRFQPENISFSGGRMILALENDGCTKYRSAEESFGFGYYEVRMRPASGSGIMAGSFFTYTGTYGRPDHDEIDIEVLGQDCSIQLNHYGAGRGGHELVMTPTQLGFNPCAGEHNYGFVWRSDSIVYYIDGRMVHRATAQIPSRPGRIMVNIWSGAPSVDGWLGPYDAGSGRVTAQYDYIRWAPLP